MATAPSPNDLTRHQLDELDALLQRMLSLPLAAGDPPASTAGPPTAANWRADPPAAGPAPAPHLAPSDLPRPPARTPRVTVTPFPAFELAPAFEHTPPPEPAVPVLAARAVADELAPVPVEFAEPDALAEADDVPIIAPPAVPFRAAGRPRPAPLPVQLAAELAPAPSSTPHSALRTPHSPLLWPAVAFDRVVYAVLGAAGPPGWLLRSGFGKNLLGLAGVGLLLYTAAHVAGQRGWVALPVALPWPR